MTEAELKDVAEMLTNEADDYLGEYDEPTMSDAERREFKAMVETFMRQKRGAGYVADAQ